MTTIYVFLGLLTALGVALWVTFLKGKKAQETETEASNAKTLQAQRDVVVPTESADIDRELREL